MAGRDKAKSAFGKTKVTKVPVLGSSAAACQHNSSGSDRRSLPLRNGWWGSGFLGKDREARQVGCAERGRNGDIRGVTAGRNQHPTDTRQVIARVENPPSVVQIYLEPRTEIHGQRGGNADVAQVPRAVARGNVQGAAEGDGQVLIIAADSDPVREHVERGPGRTCVLVPEHHFGIYPITDCLHASPPGSGSTEEFRGYVRQPIHLTVTAVQQIAKGFMGQLTYRVLARIRRDWIRSSRVFNQRRTAQPQSPLGCDESDAAIAEAVNVARDLDLGLNTEFIRCTQVWHAGGMHAQHRDHRHRRRNFKLDFVTEPDEHLPKYSPFRSRQRCSLSALFAGTRYNSDDERRSHRLTEKSFDTAREGTRRLGQFLDRQLGHDL